MSGRNKAPFCTSLISTIAPYLTNGPYTDTQSSHTSMAPRWTNTHKAQISHTLMALDLIFLLLSICAERRDALKKIAERDPFSLMKWKACVGAICQSNQRFNGGSDERGDFFFHCVTSQITWEEYKERNGVTMDGWGFYTEILITFRRRKETMGSGFLFVKLCSHFNYA